jgi:vacuolar iron transporter family protein
MEIPTKKIKLSKETKEIILTAQTNELTEYYIYKRLAKVSKNPSNKEILNHIAEDELRHCEIWKHYTGEKVKPKKFKIWFYYFIAQFLGLTFGVKLMEKGEDMAQKNYHKLSKVVPDAEKIEREESEHENELINLIQEQKLDYVGSMVLGLNDALVELTGAIAGLTFAFQNTNTVGIAGLITGIAASFSMAASEYLSKKAEGEEKTAFKASVYTGIAYIFTVFLLVLPYFVVKNPFWALATTLVMAVIIIFLFTFYISVAKDYNFKKRFWEMAGISLGVAALSFIIGILIRTFLHIEI